MLVHEFGYSTIPVVSVGFSSLLINGSESEGISKLNISWNVSGSAPLSTDYYIRLLTYEGSLAINYNLTDNFLNELRSNDYGPPHQAMQGIGIYQATKIIV